MSNDTQIKVDGRHGTAVTQMTQYGVRFPDGTTAWNVLPNTSIDFKALIEPTDPRHGNHTVNWERSLTEKAKAAKVDAVDYIESHRFIKRTVIVSVTNTEEV